MTQKLRYLFSYVIEAPSRCQKYSRSGSYEITALTYPLRKMHFAGEAVELILLSCISQYAPAFKLFAELLPISIKIIGKAYKQAN